MASKTPAVKIDVAAAAILQRLPPARSPAAKMSEITPLLINYFDGGSLRHISDYPEVIAKLIRKIEITNQIWSAYNYDWSPADDRQQLSPEVYPLLVLMLLHDAEENFARNHRALGFKALNAALKALDIHAAESLEQDLAMLEAIAAHQIHQAGIR